MPRNAQTKVVRCRCDHLAGQGTYEVSGRHLTLTSTFGVTKALLGFAKPQRLAQKLLKNLCEREAARQKAEIDAAKVPAPEVIKAVAAIDQPPAIATIK